MARRCAITGKGPRSGNNVSHAKNRTKRWFHPNLASKKVWIPELGRSVRLKISTTALKSIDRDGLLRYLKKKGLTLKDVT
jgi:large subunit ribosomal protein L28